MKIACAFDHAGFPLKEVVLETLRAAGHEPVDLGTWSTDPVDYPDTARDACEAVMAGKAARAVVVCLITGMIGVIMAALIGALLLFAAEEVVF